MTESNDNAWGHPVRHYGATMAKAAHVADWGEDNASDRWAEAHAYTHLSHDIDNERWETERFAETQLNIVEGLAQFYTQVVCKRIGQRMPAALDAYRALLDKQSGPYKAHLDWVQDDEQGGEIVRVSMIECRSKGIVASSDFAEAIRRHRIGIRGRKGQ